MNKSAFSKFTIKKQNILTYAVKYLCVLTISFATMSCSSINTEVLTKRFKANETKKGLEQTGLSSEYVNINRNTVTLDNRLNLRSTLSGSPFDKHQWNSDCDCR